MLFPLHKGFCSTRLFQTGGHHERPTKRTWTLDNPDLGSKARDLHSLLMDKKPYDEHLQLARTYSEPARLALREHAKAHQASIADIKKRCEDKAAEERQRMYENIKAYKEQSGGNEAALKASFRNQALDHIAKRDAMNKRVAELGYIWGEAGPAESAERKRQRADARREMHAETRRYLNEQRQLAKTLSESIVRPRRDTGQEEAAKEARAAEKRSQMKSDFFAYETKVEGIYDVHHKRICEVQRGHKERHLERIARLESCNDKLTQAFEKVKEKGRKEIEERDARMKARGKCLGGYVGVHKSEKRLREELAHSLSQTA